MGIGFYGKLPCRGDFVTRLPKVLVTPWDEWLQQGLAYSREQLQQNWKEAYENSPLWRFYLAAGACGESAWLGLMMPSEDKVHRYFPLTLAYEVDKDQVIPDILEPSHSNWFERLENSALYALEPECELALFEQSLQTFEAPILQPAESSSDNKNTQVACFLTCASRAEFGKRLANCLGNPPRTPTLWWWQEQDADFPATLLLSEHLPAPEKFPALLDGDWERWGWTAG